ncbi:uncharacterized protein TrAtP1_006369 [Trichoderma atroviride]|uniref:uncharacterized protein n=1 Tax=Hypocrea atroviridis TaxID=63577 RepID=UPI00331B23E7|nr:hypothetical protein TrAtP1_006369 [Trichoderma atroviride]
MERCLASIITRHGPRFYIGPRNGTRHLSSTPPICAQVKTSPAAKKTRSDPSHFDEQHKQIEALLRKIAHQIASMINQTASYRMHRALLNATSGLQFCGDITTEQSPSDAYAAAVEASSKPFADDQHIVIFVDGSLIWKPNDKSGSIAHLGAAVVYKTPQGSQDWQVRRYFALSKERNAEIAEIFAIAQGTAVAIELIMHLRNQNGSGAEKNGCQPQGDNLLRLPRCFGAGKKFLGEETCRQDPGVQRSQYL